MSTMPGAVVTAQHYHDYMILYTEGESVQAVVDGAPPGPNGRLFTVETGKAIKVPYEAGRFILDHLAYTGVVRVKETDKPDGTGTEFDLVTARAESLAKFEEEDARRWRDYVEYCLTDKLDKRKAIPATPDSIKRIIARRGYRPSDFGIAPVGEAQPKDKAVEELTALVKAQESQIAALTSKLNEALGEPVEVSAGDGKKKGK